MKSLSDYINEKLSLGDAIFRFVSKKVFGADVAKTQSEFAKEIKKFVSEHSDDKVKTSIMRVKDIEKNLSNCINKNDHVFNLPHLTVEEGIKSHKWYKDLELLDNTPFICFYNVDNKEKFFLLEESFLYFSLKDKNGNRPLKQFLTFQEDHNSYAGYLFTEEIIPRVLDPEKWNKEHEEREKSKENKKAAQARIEAIQKELEELKKQL